MRGREDLIMSKSEWVMVSAVTLVVLVVIETLVMSTSGISDRNVFWIAFVQIMLANFLVAIVDPTYGRGYIFTYTVAVAAFVFYICVGPVMVKEGILFVFACLATTWATYWVRRQWNWHRARQRSYN